MFPPLPPRILLIIVFLSAILKLFYPSFSFLSLPKPYYVPLSSNSPLSSLPPTLQGISLDSGGQVVFWACCGRRARGWWVGAAVVAGSLLAGVMISGVGQLLNGSPTTLLCRYCQEEEEEEEQGNGQEE